MNRFAASFVLFVLLRTPNVAFVAGSVAAAESGGGAVAARDAPTSGFDVPKWILPDARSVRMEGPLGDAYRKGVERLRQDPYRSAAYLRADVSLEMKRIFTNYSGDISGRFIEIASLTSPPGRMEPETLSQVLQDIGKYQKADGHFGADVDWSGPLEPESPNAVKLPIFWGHSRLLVGLLEAHRAFDRPELLQIARRIGDFYLATADRFLDPAREPEYRATGTYAAGYPTDYFPGIEGLAKLYQATRDARYLRQAERMADFFRRFDKLPIDHSHGNLITHHGLLLLYEITGNREYLDRAMRRWREATEGGYVWPMGGVGERFRVSSNTDEGCSEADWLRLNLALWRLTGQTRFLDMAERLLWNHYAMNRADNGGYGHHNFVCDADGPLQIQPKFTEAVWCCTFHGILGLETLKRHVVAGSDRGVFVNFPVSVLATVSSGRERWKTTVVRDERPGAITCAVRLDPAENATAIPAVYLRRPDWAEDVQAADRAGHRCSIVAEGGYLQIPVRPGAEGEVRVTLSYLPRIEDRRLHRLSVNGGATDRHHGVVLFDGPRLLLASAQGQRPVIVVAVDTQGRPVLSNGKDGAYSVASVGRVDAGEKEVTEALQGTGRVRLAPWDRTARDSPAAFVFDAITVPASSGVKAPGKK